MKINYLKLLENYLDIQNISYSQLTLKCGITKKEMEYIRENQFEINDLKLLVKLSLLLNVSIDWLIFGEESPEYTEFQKGYLNGLKKGFKEGFIYCKKLKNKQMDKVENSVFKINE